jgi:hypothetical protein
MNNGNVYAVRLAPTAITAAKTLIQIKAGAGALVIVKARVYQKTKTTTEFLDLHVVRKSAAATVTSFTPLKLRTGSEASLAVGGTSATGVNATAEGTDTEILDEDDWNVLNGGWMELDIPEGRIWVPQAGIIGLKLNTAPAASMTIGAVVHFMEFLG